MNTFTITENLYLSTEDFQNIYHRKPKSLTVKVSQKVKPYFRRSDRGEEAFFGENNAYKITMVALMGELRHAYEEATNKGYSKRERKKLATELDPIIKKIETHIEKTFNLEKCYLGLMEDLNAWCIPLCFDKNLVLKKDRKRFVNEKVKVSLEDIMETKTGYRYRDKAGKIYCINFGLGFFDMKKPEYTDEECAAVITHELGHAMQQAVCSINENLVSVFAHSLFEEAYSMLNLLSITFSVGFSTLISLYNHIMYKKLAKGDQEEIGDKIIKTTIAQNEKEFDRDRFGEYMKTETKAVIKSLPKKKGDNIIIKGIFSIISFLFGGTFTILFNLLYGITAIPSNIYAATQNGFLKKNRRFEQFADIYTAAYGLGTAQASALAKIGNAYHKQSYGLIGFINYVPVLNLAIGLNHYVNSGIRQLINGYPDTEGRIVAIYKSLKADLDSNKDLSAETKKEISDQIEILNSIYNDYVYDWSPKGFVFALWHKFTFKKLSNAKSDAEVNVLEALKDMDKEQKFKDAKDGKETTDIDTINIDTSKVLKILLNTIKNFKMNFGTPVKGIIKMIEPKLHLI